MIDTIENILVKYSSLLGGRMLTFEALKEKSMVNSFYGEELGIACSGSKFC